MKKIVLVALLSTAIVAPAMAGFQGNGSAASGRATGTINTVAKAKRAYDNAPFSISGRITGCYDEDSCTFRDSTGSVRIDVDESAWRGQTVTPSNTVRISGRVDRDDDTGHVTLDVYSVSR